MSITNYERTLINKVKENIISQALHGAGTAMGLDVNAITGILPVKNYTVGDGSAFGPKIGGGALTERYLTKPHACLSCPIGCKRTVKVDEGAYKMEEGPGPQYETIASFGSLLMIDDLAAVIRMGEVANQYGVDTISCGATIAFAMECFEKGLITSKDLDGGQLRWGNTDDVLEIIGKDRQATGLRQYIGGGKPKRCQEDRQECGGFYG